MQVHYNGCSGRTATRQISVFSQMLLRFESSPLRALRVGGLVRLAAVAGMMAVSDRGRAGAQSATFGGNAQHTALYTTPAQPLTRARWTTANDLNNSGALAHYG